MNQIELSDQDKRDLRRLVWTAAAWMAAGPGAGAAMWWGWKAFDKFVASSVKHDREAFRNFWSELRQGWSQDGR